MITFKGRCDAIKKSDRITRYVNSAYPHISESKTRELISRQLLYTDFGDKKNARLRDLALNFMLKMKALRYNYTSGTDLLKKIIRSLKDAKLGNCYEMAKITELTGKINGQKNIYPMKLLIPRNRSGALLPLDHVVAVLTKKKIVPEQKYVFKNNEAIILDPWLGITEFPGKYAEMLRNDFANLFPNMPDEDFMFKYFAKIYKNIRDFKKKNKEECFRPQIQFLLHEDVITKEEAELMKTEHPELIIKDFKPVN